MQSVSQEPDAATSDAESSVSSSLAGLGLILMLIGQIFHALQSIAEEYILQGREQNPLYMMGWEGVFGLFITAGLLVPATTLPCPFSESQCLNGHIEDLGLAST